MPTKKTINYQQLNTELEHILDALQSSEADIDMALALYERGAVIIKDLQRYLKDSENKITSIKQSLDKP